MRHITFIRPKLGEGAPADAMTPLVFALLKAATPADIDTVLIDERGEPYAPVPTDLVAISVESFTARRAYEIAEDYRTRGVPVVMGEHRCGHPRLRFMRRFERRQHHALIPNARSAWLGTTAIVVGTIALFGAAIVRCAAQEHASQTKNMRNAAMRL